MQETVRLSNFMQWLEALDFQHIGACRVAERLKPLLKINASTGAASEDYLLSHLNKTAKGVRLHAAAVSATTDGQHHGREG
ncbi:unnamed protein product [Amaranthus hypochondriacus]